MLNSLQPHLIPLLSGRYVAVHYNIKGTNKKEQKTLFNNLQDAQAFVDAEIVKQWFAKIDYCISVLQQPQHIKNSRTDAIAAVKKYLIVDKKAILSPIVAAKEIKAWYIPLLETIAFNSSPNGHDTISISKLLAYLTKSVLPLIPNYNELPTN